MVVLDKEIKLPKLKSKVDSFLQGFGSVLDLSGSIYFEKRVIRDLNKSKIDSDISTDKQNMKSDWEMIGKDFNLTIQKHERRKR